MRYNGKGNPLAVLVSCVTLGFLPQILFVLFLLCLPLWVYILVGFLPQILLLLGIIWIVTSIPIWLWVVMGILAFMIFVYVAFCKEDCNEKQE